MLISDIIGVVRQGRALTSAAAWANRAAATAALTGVLTGALHIARALGYQLGGIDDAALEAVAGGVAAAVCIVSSVLHVATVADAGLPATRESRDPGDSRPLGG